MDLQEFVHQSLVQIIEGVSSAQEATKERGTIINPQTMAGSELRRTSQGHPIVDVELDVAITATSGTETKGGIGVVVGALALGSHGKSDAQDSMVSRIRFTVPVALPKGD